MATPLSSRCMGHAHVRRQHEFPFEGRAGVNGYLQIAGLANAAATTESRALLREQKYRRGQGRCVNDHKDGRMPSSPILDCSRWPKSTVWRFNPDETATNWRAPGGRTVHRVGAEKMATVVPHPSRDFPTFSRHRLSSGPSCLPACPPFCHTRHGCHVRRHCGDIPHSCCTRGFLP